MRSPTVTDTPERRFGARLLETLVDMERVVLHRVHSFRSGGL